MSAILHEKRNGYERFLLGDAFENAVPAQPSEVTSRSEHEDDDDMLVAAANLSRALRRDYQASIRETE